MSQQPFPFIPSGSTDDKSSVVGASESTTAATSGPGGRGYVIALVAGIPVALLMALSAIASIVDGELPGLIMSLMGVSAATGSGFAVVGMRQRPRRFRAAALWLTLPPVVMFIAGVLMFVLLIVVLSASGTGG